MPEKKIGIFDPEGLKDNPLTGIPYQNIYEETTQITLDGKKVPGTYKNYAKIVHMQPLIKDINQSYDILDKLRNHQVLVIESATGTGKTVVLPKLAAHLLDYKELVVVTVPKKNLAEVNAGFCAKCMDVRLGDEVGFAYKGSKIMDTYTTEEGIEVEEQRNKGFTKDSKIMFVTDGWLAGKISDDLTMEGYGLIMIDEVHERNERIDVLLVKIRSALMLNPKLKIIITSATLEMDLFVNYFKEVGLSVASKTVAGKPNKPVKVFHENVKINGNNMADECVKAYKKYLYNKNIKEDCIIFVNSGKTGEKVCKALRDLDKRIYCIVADSGTIKGDDDLVDKAAEDPKKDPYLKELYEREGYDRRVSVATDVWESSITLPLMKFVIDSGVVFSTGYDGEKMSSSLKNTQIARGQAKQRLGRVGRTSPGTCIFLYSEKVYEKMEESKEPGLLKEDFAKYILDIWIQDDMDTLRNVITYIQNFITIPKSPAILSGLRSLYALGYSTGYKNGEDELTEMGFYLAHRQYNIDSDIRYTKAYYYANIYDCRDQVALILSLIFA
jgi:pre-mRNA-splicing factor ATP-dependent RNA helicase DHX15/PRP43